MSTSHSHSHFSLQKGFLRTLYILAMGVLLIVIGPLLLLFIISFPLVALFLAPLIIIMIFILGGTQK